jgi:hypothetical protein
MNNECEKFKAYKVCNDLSGSIYDLADEIFSSYPALLSKNASLELIYALEKSKELVRYANQHLDAFKAFQEECKK